MNVNEYRKKMVRRKTYLLKEMMEIQKTRCLTQIEEDIYNLEFILCDITPYSRYWRYGYISTLKRAISLLKKYDAIAPSLPEIDINEAIRTAIGDDKDGSK